jgi:hypothetical protein
MWATVGTFATCAQMRFFIKLFFDQLLPKARARLDAPMKISQVEFLIRAMRVVVVASPAEQQRVDAE